MRPVEIPVNCSFLIVNQCCNYKLFLEPSVHLSLRVDVSIEVILG